jgi:uncharacterized membrane protein YeaQ/YmgE (transglycosylase-associated protein family)
MIRKLILTVGILGALAAAEGLNRFGGLVSAFGGADAPFYIGMLIVSVLGAAVLLLALVGKSSRAVKWITFVVFAACFVLMLNAPAFPVNIQILFGLAVATGATVWVRPAS